MDTSGTACLEPGTRRKFAPMSDGSGEKQEISPTRAHILLFEDDRDSLAGLLARVLRTEGYVVDLLRIGRRGAARHAKLMKYDVVLSDIHLANDTNGHDVR